MTARKIGLMVLLALAAGLVAAGESNAAPQWYICQVNLAGPAGALTLVRLTDIGAVPAFTKKWFLAPADRAKEMLAVAMAAMTNGMTVKVYVDISVADEYPPITSFYLRP